MMVLSRDLGIFAVEWAGWTIRDGSLYSPEGWSVTRNDALAVPLLRQQVNHYQAENRMLREKPPDIDEQPTPAEWDLDTLMAG